MKKYSVELFVTEDDRHSPYLIAGLLELERVGVVELTFKSMPLLVKNRWILNSSNHRSSRGYPWCPEAVVTRNKDGASKRIGIDLQDWAYFFSFHAVKNCEIIFKRAYDPLLLSEYESKFPIRIIPFGPNHSCEISDLGVLKAIRDSARKQLVAKAVSEPSKITRKLYRRIIRTKEKAVIFDVDNILSDPPKADYIFFQVECHTWKSNINASGLNEFRANLIRELRAKLGDKFVGGMFFKGEVDPNFKDCMTNVDPDPSNYRRFVENAAAVVSTNGFGNSIPWKLTEYMKWGCCILTERNKHAFREPIRANTVNEFESAAECVESCLKLLADAASRRSQMISSRKYYDEQIAPARSVLWMLENTFFDK